MILARITGSVVSTVKNRHLENNRLLLMRPLDLDGRFNGPEAIALDLVDAGVGDTVIVVKEGGSARIAFDNENIPLQYFVVGVMDQLEINAEARTLVEWTIGTSTALRMVRPAGGSAAAPRYYRGGIRLDEGFDLVTALRRDFAEQKRGRAILRAMGAVPRNTALAPKPGG